MIDWIRRDTSAPGTSPAIDDDGFVWIEGRVGDVINRGGNKVFPGQVEEVLLLAPGVSEVAVVGLPDDRLGEVPVAFVVGDANDAELDRLCRDHLVAYKIPVAFRHVEELPKSEVGKVLRRELVAMAAARRTLSSEGMSHGFGSAQASTVPVLGAVGARRLSTQTHRRERRFHQQDSARMLGQRQGLRL